MINVELGHRKTKKPNPTIGTPDALPNYMKPTNSSGSRNEQLQVSVNSPINDAGKGRLRRNWSNLNCSKLSSSSPSIDGSIIEPARYLTRSNSLKPVRPSMKKSSAALLCPNKHVSRTTCSSMLKGSKVPKASSLVEGGAPVMKACTYTYCSLHGHKKEHVLPLNCFMPATRQSIRAQESMKLECSSSSLALGGTLSGLKVNPLLEDETGDFYVEIYAKPRAQTVELENCDGRENGTCAVDDALAKDKEGLAVSGADLSALFEVIDINSEDYEHSYPDSKTDYSDKLDHGNFDDYWLDDKEATNDVTIIKAEKGRKMTAFGERRKKFNLRAPRFLEVEQETEAEKVDLRHRLMDGRKNSEEWMIDYKLRKTVRKLAPARKRKVELLVEAFETITVFENHSLQLYMDDHFNIWKKKNRSFVIRSSFDYISTKPNIHLKIWSFVQKGNELFQKIF